MRRALAETMVLEVTLIRSTIGLLLALWQMLLIVMVSMDLSVIWVFRDPLREISSSTDILIFPAKGVERDMSHTVNRMDSLMVLLFSIGKFFLMNVHLNCALRDGRIIALNYRPGSVMVSYEKYGF